ncbi:hypothetical protein Tel_09800 [Candidatus Tenderia electrophaga]|jgi:hypothetical protein|uniref:Small-conductance mechanosensitive channel n=1 Tax=Candidatus Tenderia electrophaga TaxID=1748243 RepID=A0A0S2TE34_9GAMM|nr:hypothetical protein Tel_09800 [Candidatus Tenderia electrophaga]
MNENNWLDTLTHSLVEMLNAVLAWLPQLLAALVVLMAGWVLARLLRRFVVRLAEGLDHLWHRLTHVPGLKTLQSAHPPTRLLGLLVFWLVLIFFFAVAAHILELEFITAWIGLGLGYLPVILLSALIIAVGVFLASLCRRLVESAMFAAGVAQARLLAQVMQGVIIVLTVVLALAQLGIDVSFLATVFGITLAAVLSAIALAFGIGARDYVANVLAAHQVRRRYHTGDMIRVLDVQGRLLSITATMVILDSDQGEVSLPANLFSRHLSTLVDSVPDDEE